MDMNDKNNLDFLLRVSEKGLKEWYKQATDDDIQYALELMNWFQDELDDEMIENQLKASDYKETSEILARIMQ